MPNGNGGAAAAAGSSENSAQQSRRPVVGLDVEVVIRQKSPLLMHRMTDEHIERVLIHGERPLKDKTSPLHVIAEKFIYRDADDVIGLPAGMLRACLRNAGRDVTVSGKTKLSKASGETSIPAILTIEDDFLPLELPEKNPWKVDLRRGQMDNGTAVGIVRPRFDKWGFRVHLHIDLTAVDGVTEAMIQKLFVVAGNKHGVGSFRPNKGGDFGRFEVAEWNVTERHYS